MPETTYPPTPFLTSVRFRLSLICFFGFAVLYMQRVNLSIAMVAMVKPVQKANKSSATSENCKVSDKKGEEAKYDFDWDKELQGNILGSFFYGYLVLQIPGGMLSEKLGAKHVVTAGMLPVAILTLMTPMLTKIHYGLLIAARVVIGLGEAVLYPAAIALWGVWSPPLERSKLVGISLSGGQFGNAFVLPLGGLMCGSVGWEVFFYFVGAIGLLFCVVWMLYVADTPAKHTGLSDAERNYLLSVIQSGKSRPEHTPWKQIFFSTPVVACYTAHICGNYAYYMNLTQIPTYMKEVLHFNIKANGALSMLPYLLFWASTMALGVVSDKIIGSGVPIGQVRKSFAFMGLMGPAVFLVATSYITCSTPYVAVAFLCLAVGFTSFGFTSYMVNHGDLAPMYAGTLFGISNTLATIPGIFAPYIVGAITKDGTQTQWQLAFFIAAGINLFGAIFYVLFSSGETQPWAAASHGAPRERAMSTVIVPLPLPTDGEDPAAGRRTTHTARKSVCAMAAT